MNLNYFKMLFDYNCWANARVLDCASKLSEAEYTAVRPGVGSVRSKLTHALGGEVMWLARFKGTSPKSMLKENELPTFEALRKRWQQQEEAMTAYVASLNDAALDAPITYRSTEGETFTRPLSYLLAHLANHGTHTRSEVAVLLTELGHSPGDLDLVLYLRERGM